MCFNVLNDLLSVIAAFPEINHQGILIAKE